LVSGGQVAVAASRTHLVMTSDTHATLRIGRAGREHARLVGQTGGGIPGCMASVAGCRS
jgi:hypothetical protein